jgi:beta-lactamase regulating signal transducer with metallopeptidase domain
LFIPILGRALLHFVWEGAVIGLVAALLLHALRDARRPHARYAVACLALLACALAPLLDIAWQLAAARPLAAPALVGTSIAVLPTLGHATQALAHAWNFDDALPAIVALWASGACVLLLRMAAGVWWIQRLCRAPQGPLTATWQARLDVLARRFGMQRPIALRLVDAIASPASVGWWRPVVLLPTALLARMPVELIEALLAHELAHIRRHDYFVNLLQGAVEALLFYHPVTWWLSRCVRREREQVADHLAAQAIGEPRRLALALSELSACLPSTERLPSLALAAHGGHLMSRIEQLVRPALRRNRGGRIAFPLLGAAIACVALIAHAQVGAPAPNHAIARNAAPAPSVHVATAPAGAARQVIRLDNKGHDSYALVRKNRNDITMSGSVSDVKGINALRRDIDSDFLWVRRNGKQWVIVDPDTIARAERAWAPIEPLDRQMETLDAQMDVYDKKMEALDAQMDKLSEQQDDHPQLDAASARMEELGRQQEALGEQQEDLGDAMAEADAAKQESLSRKMQALSAQQKALAEKMREQSRVIEAEGARVQQNHQPMEALGKQMEEAGKPMEALGKQIDAIGKQMDAMSDKAERETFQLIDEAIAKGLAKPAPVRQ